MASSLFKAKLSRRRLRKPERTVAPVRKSKAVEMMYRSEMEKMMARLFNAIDLSDLEQATGFTTDAALPDVITRMIDRLKSIFGGLEVQSDRIAKLVVGRASSVHEARFVGGIKRELGIDIGHVIRQNPKVAARVAAMTRQNAALIKSIPQEYIAKVEKTLLKSLTQGSKESLIKEIQKIHAVTTSKARFIARDQTAKFNGVLTEARQTAIGVEEYDWVTSRDSRVRDSHEEKDGQRFRWDSPPSDTGHPGHDYNCRCTARAVIKL